MALKLQEIKNDHQNTFQEYITFSIVFFSSTFCWR
jgi:hypothetical protein